MVEEYRPHPPLTSTHAHMCTHIYTTFTQKQVNKWQPAVGIIYYLVKVLQKALETSQICWYISKVYTSSIAKSHHSKLYILFYYIYLFVHGSVWRSENNFQESILSFYSVSLRDQIRVPRLSGKCLSPLSHLTGSVFLIIGWIREVNLLNLSSKEK